MGDLTSFYKERGRYIYTQENHNCRVLGLWVHCTCSLDVDRFKNQNQDFHFTAHSATVHKFSSIFGGIPHELFM
jgi:hypothetical protein